MMIVLLTACTVSALTTSQQKTLVSRREGLASAIGASVATIAGLARAEEVDLSSIETTGVGAERNFVKRERFEPQQYAPVGKLDVNAATVVEYKAFKGLYPKVAGKIASNGPYTEVKDVRDAPIFPRELTSLQVYKVLNKEEASRFRKHEAKFVALPPGRMFIERINQRQSL
ncbi:hypothetical protein CTAYLR_005358 [Chrysophaeum taylorii]|uniref:Photosystem II 12 kDa extrinsic protein n=1 Tax=Chrysophaeum taylorii TaxID=2483200 RepID=A0AAD7U996_9STRA|nr:hypothetical protein CTAYLR_005358 [Chrysophaeum taylorii]